jgi:hypothetical protein
MWMKYGTYVWEAPLGQFSEILNAFDRFVLEKQYQLLEAATR